MTDKFDYLLYMLMKKKTISYKYSKKEFTLSDNEAEEDPSQKTEEGLMDDLIRFKEIAVEKSKISPEKAKQRHVYKRQSLATSILSLKKKIIEDRKKLLLESSPQTSKK